MFKQDYKNLMTGKIYDGQQLLKGLRRNKALDLRQLIIRHDSLL